MKQSYEIRKPKKTRVERELKFTEFDGGVILDDFGIDGLNIEGFQKDMEKIMEEEEEEDKKDCDKNYDPQHLQCVVQYQVFPNKAVSRSVKVLKTQ